MGAWGAGAALSAALGLAMLRVWPRVGRAWSWLVEKAGLSRYLLAEYVLGLGAAQLGILLVGVIVGETGVGSLRAAQVLLGPLGILSTAAFQFAVPEVARNIGMPLRGVCGASVPVCPAACSSAHLAYISLLLLIPDPIGFELFGDSWAGADSVLLAMSLAACFSCLANGPAGVLYGLGWARTTFRINLVKGPMLLIAVPVGHLVVGGDRSGLGPDGHRGADPPVLGGQPDQGNPRRAPTGFRSHVSIENPLEA